MALHFILGSYLLKDYFKYLPYYDTFICTFYGACIFGYMWVTVNCLIVKFDFDSAQVKLGECERVLSNDFFLCHQTDLFMEEARVFVFENYCRIHTKIDLKALGDKLAMDQEQAERWIVDLIRNADLDAKIDADQGCVIMGGTPQSIYEQVIDRTRDLNLRSATLTQNLSRMLNEARKEKAKRERASKTESDEY